MRYDLGVVSGTFNRLPHLRSMVESVRNNIPTGIRYIITLVDGGSTDGTIEWAESQPDIQLIHGDLEGAIKAFTQGAYATDARRIILSNDDITFLPGSIMKAMHHLETHPNCGAVAFADNRHPEYKRETYEVSYMEGNGKPVVYAQVGMFRKWLGDFIGWWGYGVINAKTYGGDNYASARIWELGYTVEAVSGVAIHDHVLEDSLRQLNRTYEDKGYHELYPSGLTIPTSPQIDQQDKEQLRIIYLPIYEDRPIQRAQKKGLRQALAKHYLVWEIDYYNTKDIMQVFEDALNTFKPHMVLSQFHGVDDTTAGLLRVMQRVSPATLRINWNGDYWFHGLTTETMLLFLREFDLQLTVNGAALPTYEAHKIPAAYWQNAYEPVDETTLPDYPEYDVVLLGNNNHAHVLRGQIEDMLEELHATHGITYGLYGDGWKTKAGETLYNFSANRAIYRKAKIAISDAIENGVGFVSDRFFQIGIAGGAMCLQEHIHRFEDFTGYVEGTHYVEWNNLEDLRAKILQYVGDDAKTKRKKIVKANLEFTRKSHSFDARVRELADLIALGRRRVGGVVRIVNIAARHEGGITGAITGNKYLYKPQTPLDVDARDAEFLLKEVRVWQRV